MFRLLILAAVALASCSTAHAAVLNGVTMPDIRVVDGTRLTLNGIGIRTYSILRIRIYVAGLYLERRNDNADSILHSPAMKLLDIRFLRNVDAADARKAWQDGFANNCRLPGCYLDPRDVQRFLAAVPPIHRGDETAMIFTATGVDVSFNGRPLGDITDRHFADVLLSTFIGPKPPTLRIKRELLGRSD